MKITPELYILVLAISMTMLMWIPYTVARIFKRGLIAALGNPHPSLPTESEWALRAKSAHLNAIENIAIFAPLVIILSMMNLSFESTILATKVYLIARLVHYIVYSAGIPIVRTLAFLTGFGATTVIAITILGQIM